MAKQFGATDVVNAAERDAVGAVTELTGGRGADVAFEVIGLKETIEATIDMVRPGGEAVLVGVPRMDVMLELNAAFTFLYLNKTVKGCWYGSVNVHEDVPKLLDLWKQGRLKLEELISQEITVGRRERGLRCDGAGRGRPLGHPLLIPQDRSLTSGGTPGVDTGSGAAGRTADPWPCAWSGPGGRAREGAAWTAPARMWELVARVS